MSAFRFYNPAPVFLDLLGLEPVAGGFLYFYDKGTTTPRLTWSDQGLSIPNTNPVALDSSGRSNTNIWLDGEYTVVLKSATNLTIWTRDVASGVADSLAIPTPLPSGQWLTNDGTNLLWGTFFMLPDPTGSDGFTVTASGGGYVLTAPAAASPNIPVVTSNSVKTGTILDQWGTGTIPASGTQVATATINFPTPYATTPVVTVGINRGSGVVAAGFIGCLGWTASTTGIAVAWDLNITQSGSQYNLVAPIPISWRAIGTVAA